MKFSISVFFIVWVSPFFGQSIQIGESYSFEKGFYPISLVGLFKNECVLIRANTNEKNQTIKDLRIELFDTNTLKISNTWALNGLFDNKHLFYPEDIRIFNNQLYVFGSSYNKQNKTNELQVFSVDSAGKQGSKIRLQSCETNHFNIKKKRFYISSNRKQELLAVVSLNEINTQSIPKLNLSVYTKNFEVVKSLNAFIPIQGKNAEIEELLLDEYGNVHILVKSLKSEDSLNLGFTVYAFPVMNDEVLEYQLNVPGKGISSLKMRLDNDSKLLIAGMLRDEFQKMAQVSSLFFLRIDRESGTIENKGIQRLDNEFKSLFIGDKKQIGLDDFSGFKTQRIIPNGQGGILLIAECIEQDEICDSDYRTGIETCHTFYNAGNIVVVSFNERAEIDWYQTIEKKQKTQDDDGMCLSFLDLSDKSGDSHYFFNVWEEEKERFRSNRFDEIQLQEVTLKGNGQLTTHYQSLEKPIMPSIFFKLSNGTIFTLGQTSENAALIKITPQ